MHSIAAALAALAALPSAADVVSLRSLLCEMTDPDANTYLPSPRYTARLWSSCDRKTTTPDAPGWFANDDFNQFIRSETSGGRAEYVMVDAKGPGAITRVWLAAGNGGRALDAIPFRKSVRFLMEMYPWHRGLKIDFAPLACWYMRPGGKASHGEAPEAVKRYVRLDYVKPQPPKGEK